jgi:hypothetical protein
MHSKFSLLPLSPKRELQTFGLMLPFRGWGLTQIEVAKIWNAPVENACKELSSAVLLDITRHFFKIISNCPIPGDNLHPWLFQLLHLFFLQTFR